MPEEILYIESRRAARVKNVQMFQDVFGAVLLISGALEHLRHAAHFSVLPWLELLAAGTLILSAVREKVRHRSGHGHDRVAWVEIAGAVMLFVEALQRTQEHHHLSFKVLQFLPPLLLLLLALFHERLGKYYVKATDEALILRTRRFWQRRLEWRDLSSYDLAGTRFTFATPSGDTRILDLGDAKDRDAAVAWTVERLAAHQVERRQSQSGQSQGNQ